MHVNLLIIYEHDHSVVFLMIQAQSIRQRFLQKLFGSYRKPLIEERSPTVMVPDPKFKENPLIKFINEGKLIN